jgi:hypothetical protein
MAGFSSRSLRFGPQKREIGLPEAPFRGSVGPLHIFVYGFVYTTRGVAGSHRSERLGMEIGDLAPVAVAGWVGDLAWGEVPPGCIGVFGE